LVGGSNLRIDDGLGGAMLTVWLRPFPAATLVPGQSVTDSALNRFDVQLGAHRRHQRGASPRHRSETGAAYQ
jgi:hypothetical protein